LGKTSKRRLRSDFSFGGEQAEADPLLERAFYASGDYASIASRTDPRCFIVGRTGGGKSAALQHLEEEHSERVVRIAPEDLSLPYITDLGVIRYLDSLDVRLDLLFIALWKHVLLVELLRHRYSINSPVAKENFLSNLRERVKRNPAKQAALEYLNDFQGRFWCEADERVKEITESFEKKIDAEAKTSFGLGSIAGVGMGLQVGTTFSSETRAEQAERFQRIVNETQLARLNQMVKVLDEDILDSEQNFTYVVIDDLDRDWVDARLANDLVRCLFRSVLDLKRVRNLKILVALRTNIFEQLDFGLRSGAQEEKFRSLILQMRWTQQSLKFMLDERARAAAESAGIEDVSTVRDLLPRSNKARGDPVDVILGRTLMRPRDAIAYLNEALHTAAGKSGVSWTDISAAERPYSEKRLLALRDEWKASYPDIDVVFRLFESARPAMDKQDFTHRLDDAMLLLADPNFRGARWMTDLADSMWNAGSAEREWVDLYRPLTKLLFDIGFVGLSRSAGGPPTYAHDDPLLADSRDSVDASRFFMVHPMFHSALSIRNQRGLEST
jgi:hypothetical protein